MQVRVAFWLRTFSPEYTNVDVSHSGVKFTVLEKPCWHLYKCFLSAVVHVGLASQYGFVYIFPSKGHVRRDIELFVRCFIAARLQTGYLFVLCYMFMFF